MSLARRIERLEHLTRRDLDGLPAILFHLVDPDGRVAGYWRLAPGEPEQRFDKDMNQLPGPE